MKQQDNYPASERQESRLAFSHDRFSGPHWPKGSVSSGLSTIDRGEFVAASKAVPKPFPSEISQKGPQQPQKEVADEYRKPKILVVEDNWDHACLVVKSIVNTGLFLADLAGSAMDALYKLSTDEFSALLIDYRLSGMNGLDLIKKLKEENYQVPCVMITGLGSEAIAVEAMKLGAYDYIVKSGDYFATLPHVIVKALETYELKKIKEQWEYWLLKRNMDLGTINTIASEINKSLMFNEVLKVALEKTVEALRADFGKIRFIKERGNKLASFARCWIPVKESRKLPLLSEITEQMRLTREPLIVEDTATLENPIWVAASKEIKSVAYVPLMSHEKVCGIFALGSRRRNHFLTQDALLLTTIGGQIGGAFENAKLYEELRSQTGKLKEDLAKNLE